MNSVLNYLEFHYRVYLENNRKINSTQNECSIQFNIVVSLKRNYEL